MSNQRFIEQKIIDDKVIDLCIHKTTQSIVRSANDRFAPHIKTGIYDYSVFCQIFKFIDKLPESTVCTLAEKSICVIAGTSDLSKYNLSYKSA